MTNTREKVACFIHSTTMDLNKDTFLMEILDHLKTSRLLENLSYLCINNTGLLLDEAVIERKYAPAKVIHCLDKTNEFENPTIKLLYAFSKLNPEYKILYMHTKGVSYTTNHVFYPGVHSWNRFMRYCLVDHYPQCLNLLEVYDTVGCNYRQLKNGNPQHYSGNYWWASARYISTLRIAYLRDKYEPEFWLMANNPLYFNIYTLENMYEQIYPIESYQDKVSLSIADNVLCYNGEVEHTRLANILTMLSVQSGKKILVMDDFCDTWNDHLKPFNITLVSKNNVQLEITKVEYGLRNVNIIDVTHKITSRYFSPNRLFIPMGTRMNDAVEDDPCPGKYKLIFIEYTLNSFPFHKVYSERNLSSSCHIEINDSSPEALVHSKVLPTPLVDTFLEILKIL
jgi:hypothetical protein